jgi:hypothetical protein
VSVTLDPLGRADCLCQRFVDGEGATRSWSTGPRHVLCECGHSAAWHEDKSGPCTFPTPAAKRIREAMVAAGQPDVDPEPAYWELVAAGETPAAKPTAVDLQAWNEQTRILWLAADVAGTYGDQMLAQACTNLVSQIVKIASRASRDVDDA